MAPVRHEYSDRRVERADQAGLPCYLETSDPANIPFYERFGFSVSDASLALVPEGPTHVAMRRPPSAAEQLGASPSQS